MEKTDKDFLTWFESLYQVDQKYFWDALEDNIAYTNLLLAWDSLNKSYENQYSKRDINRILDRVFSNRLSKIEKFPKLFSDWVHTLDSHVERKISSIDKDRNDVAYISFNYTRILEDTYGIPEDMVFHIHGCVVSKNLLFGHGYTELIDGLIKDKQKAVSDANIKNLAIIDSLITYLKFLYKDTGKQIVKLADFSNAHGPIDEFRVIGSSISTVDRIYFKILDEITGRKAKWKIYYFTPESPYRNQVKSDLKYKLNKATIPDNRIQYISTDEIFS